MEFIYASELKNRFSVFGHYYHLLLGGKNFPCRSSLEITAIDHMNWNQSIPDAVVIMMNPGSSRPVKGNYHPPILTTNDLFSGSRNQEYVPVRPDNTQYQIMRLMCQKVWQHVRIINLSDLRNGNSGQFSEQFKMAHALDDCNPHSLTHPQRRSELFRLCPENSLNIAAWGSLPVLREVAIRFLALRPKVIGLNLEKPWYRFASPYRKDHKLDWLVQIDKIISKA